MALITCIDCGKQHSDLAVACPNCARPHKSLAPSRILEAQALAPAPGEHAALFSYSALRFLGWVWIILSGLAAWGSVWAGNEARYGWRYHIPVWYGDISGTVAVAILLQGVTLGVFLIVMANGAERRGGAATARPAA